MVNPEGKQRYGLIGYPVKHSFSGLMHNAAFTHYGMDAVYELFEVAPDRLEEFFKKTVGEKKLCGFNITVPHKEKAVFFLDGEKDKNVVMAQAVNTIRVEADGRLSGFNTDGEGFCRDLQEKGVVVGGKNIALIGAGGGAKAVAIALAGLGPKRLLIFDLEASRSRSLVAILKEFYPQVAAWAVDDLNSLKIEEADLLINATPVGMKETDPLLVPDQLLRHKPFVYDLIYNPVETKLLKTAKAVGCRVANGLGMLLHQGCLAFEIWTRKTAPTEVMQNVLRTKNRV
ncbi:MAG: shikimate dehydrogenase [Candidatus Omnitrophota bacterium]